MREVKRSKLGRNLLIVGRIVLATIFIVAAYAKMRPQPGMPWDVRSVKISLSMFAMGVDSYEMLPPWAVGPLAHLLPPFELFLGLWILSGIALRYSALIATLLIGGFIYAMTRAYMLHLGINCGCFGPGEQVGPMSLLRDGSMLPLALAITVGAFVLNRKPRNPSSSAVNPAIQHAE
jgi:uncharacterized membrane protein YphA (DoxX/SURF4 family)